MKNTIKLFSLFFVAFLLVSCFNTKLKNIETFEGIPELRVPISESEALYDSIMNMLSKPKFVILKEDDKTLFADLDKVVDFNGKYYILDMMGGRTCVSFTHEGNAYAKYGCVGQGPGEYVAPSDMAVDEDGVYILDANARKLIKYTLDGKFRQEYRLPFTAEAMSRLPNGEFIFNLMPDGDGGSQICVSDSTVNELRYIGNYPKEYLGGIMTTNIFRKTGTAVAYYRAPSDTLTIFGSSGIPTKNIVFDFADKALPKAAKLDYLAARNSGMIDNALWLEDSPIQLDNGVNIALGWSGDNRYIVVYDPDAEKSGIKKFDKSSSVYDINYPIAADRNGNLICAIDVDLAEYCKDYDALPDSIKDALQNANRVLLIYDLKSK